MLLEKIIQLCPVASLHIQNFNLKLALNTAQQPSCVSLVRSSLSCARRWLVGTFYYLFKALILCPHTLTHLMTVVILKGIGIIKYELPHFHTTRPADLPKLEPILFHKMEEANPPTYAEAPSPHLPKLFLSLSLSLLAWISSLSGRTVPISMTFNPLSGPYS